MSIINRDDFAVESPYWRLLDWNDHDYWYTNDLNITGSVVQMICSDENLFLLVCDEFEAKSDIVRQIDNLRIPRSKVVLISENHDLDGIDYWAHCGEMGVKLQAARFRRPLKTLEKKHYDKAFLNLNRRWRLHRPCLIGLLQALNILDKGLVSLGRSDDQLDWDTVFNTVANLIKEDEELHSLFVSNKESICKIPDMYLDTQDLITPRDRILLPDVAYDDTLKMYQDTYFSIASETYFFDGPGRFLSEKTFKPIAFNHPFILVSQPKSLELLRTLGYKTFHPYIDESYDAETNDVTRLKLILKEIERLSKFNDDEVAEFIDMVKPIANHNYYNMSQRQNKQYIHKR
jgi:hypothetical protein